jgi:hypothetical protein
MPQFQESRKCRRRPTSLALDGEASGGYSLPHRRRGGTGRRAGLKIQYQQWCVGSTPSGGILFFLTPKTFGVPITVVPDRDAGEDWAEVSKRFRHG